MRAIDDKEHIEHGNWETCCVKKRPAGDEKAGIMGYSAFGVITTGRSLPIVIYLRDEDGARDFSRTKEYDTVDAMLADGWMVD